MLLEIHRRRQANNGTTAWKYDFHMFVPMLRRRDQERREVATGSSSGTLPISVTVVPPISSLVDNWSGEDEKPSCFARGTHGRESLEPGA